MPATIDVTAAPRGAAEREHALAPFDSSAGALTVHARAAERALDGVRAQLDRAETPVAVNRARLSAEALLACLRNAVDAGAWHLGEVHRQGHLLTLEARVKLGEVVRSPATEATSRPTVPQKEGRMKIDGSKLYELAKATGIPRTTLRECAQLALARRQREADFDALVLEALDAGKLPPLAKLRALAKGPPRERKARATKDAQIAVRLEAEDLAALDEVCGGDRAGWVRELILDGLESVPVALLERVADQLRRIDSAEARKAVRSVEAALEAVRA